MHKKMMQLAVPLVLSNISLPLCGIVNSALMGHLSHSGYLAASALGVAIITFMSALFYFLRMSTTGVIAQKYAQKDYKSLQDWLAKALIIAVAISLILIGLQAPLWGMISYIITASEPVRILLSQYFHIAIYALLFILLNYVTLGFFIAIQRSYLAFIMALVTSVSGIVFSLVFVLFFKLGILGIAYSVLISQALTFCFSFCYVIQFCRHEHIHLMAAIFNTQQLRLQAYRCFFSLNSDIFIRSLCLQLSINSFFIFSGAYGESVLAANTLLVEFAVLLAMFLDALANATETMVAESYAKADAVRLKKVLKVTIFYTCLLSILFVMVYALVYPWVFSLLTSIDTVRALAEKYVVFSILFPLFAMFSYWLDGIFVGLLKTTIMRNAMLLSTLLYLLMVALLWPLGNTGLWSAYLLFFVFRAISLGLPLRNCLKVYS